MTLDLQHVQASWAGRITLSKMYLLPNVLNTFRTTPITFLQSHLNKIQAIITTFIWKGKHPRIKRAIMCTPTWAGGMEAPNIKAYFKAIILDQARIWWKPASQHTWIQIERTVLSSCSKFYLSALLLHHGTHTYLSTINAIVKMWRAIHQQTKGILHRSLSFIPLAALTTFIPDISFSNCITAGFQNIGNIYHNSILLKFQQL